MPFDSEYFPEQPSGSTSTEDRRAFKKILYGIFGFYTAAIVCLSGAAIAGTNFQKVAHILLATWS